MLMNYFIFSSIFGLILLGLGLWMASRNIIWSCLIIALGSSIISLIGLVVAIIILKGKEENAKVKAEEDDRSDRFIE